MELAIKQVEPGMVACLDVRDRLGRVLVPAGTPLDARKIKLLKAWGVNAIDVQGQVLEQIPLQDLAHWEAEAVALINPADREHALLAKLLPQLVQQLAKAAK